MQATTDELSILLRMQQIDLELNKAKKKLEALPQRAEILAARQKKQAMEQKHVQIAELRKQAEAKASKLEQEDAMLLEKQHHVQDTINEARGDYRSVEAHTKELNGFAKRRNTLEEELSKLGEELAKIEGVQKQVDTLLKNIIKQETTAVESFQQQGGALQSDIGRISAEREHIAGSLSDELRSIYEQTAERMGGVGVGLLNEGRCGVCRTLIDEGHLIDLKAQAPLGICPNCKRLLVVM